MPEGVNDKDVKLWLGASLGRFVRWTCRTCAMAPMKLIFGMKHSFKLPKRNIEKKIEIILRTYSISESIGKFMNLSLLCTCACLAVTVKKLKKRPCISLLLFRLH